MISPKLLFILGVFSIFFGVALIKGVLKHYKKLTDISEPIHIFGIVCALIIIFAGTIGAFPLVYDFLIGFGK